MDLNRSLIYHGGKQVEQISLGANNKLYEWKIDDVALGPPVSIPYTTFTTYDMTLMKWETFTTPGVNGSKIPQAKSNYINGRSVGQVFDHFDTIIREPVRSVRTIGTRHINTLKKSETVSDLNYAATSEHPLKKRISFVDYKWPINTKAYVTFRVTNGGLNNSNVSGNVRFKHANANLVDGLKFNAIVDTSDVDSSGNPLCVVIASMNSTTTTHFAEYIDLFFEQSISNIYDINVYFEKGELLAVRVTGEPIIYNSFVSGTNTFNNHYVPFVKTIDRNKQYRVKTQGATTGDVQVRLIRVSTKAVLTIGTLKTGNTEGIIVPGSTLINASYPDGLATQYGTTLTTPNPNLFLEAYEV